MHRDRLIVLIAVLLVLAGLVPEARPARADDSATNDTPTALVGSGVFSYDLAAPKIFWHTGVDQCPPTVSPDAPAGLVETIKRIATYGSPVRTLLSETRVCDGGEVRSKIVADAEFVYWLGPVGMMRLSTDANVGDLPEIVNALVDYPGELAMASDRIWAIYHDTSFNTTNVGYVLKSGNHARVSLYTVSTNARNIQTDEKYGYYMENGNLYRLDPATANRALITTGVSGYYPEGHRSYLCGINPIQFCPSEYVFIAKGRYIYRYDNLTGVLGSAIYTSGNTTAYIAHLVSSGGGLLDPGYLFFIERLTGPGDPFASYTYYVKRKNRSTGDAADLYGYGPVYLNLDALTNLSNDNSYLFWQEDGKVQRLPNNAAALPPINLRITGVEVTQGIQDTANSVLLIQNRRTFVRLYVKSDGSSEPGITAQLTARGLTPSTLQPVNTTGTNITVRSNPDRTDLDQSFLFELPWSWTKGSSLTFSAILNPYSVPPETNYSDNTTSRTVSFNPSPTLSAEFFRLNYVLNNTTYSPRIQADVVKTYSWIMRAYPIGGAVGENFKPRLWDVDGGTLLGSLVNTTHPICGLLYGGPDDDIHLCASLIANGWLWSYRIQTLLGMLDVGLNPYAFYYGMISDAAGFFPRGQAAKPYTSVGPAGTPGSGNWDTDGSYADWYAAHEIGHTLGRAHPNPGSDNPNTDASENCGHSRSDPSYPYGDTSHAATPIGPADGSMEGFDFGDPFFGIARRVYPSSSWNDVMSYCNNQWISDYTYEAMYNYMIGHPSLQSETLSPAQVAVSGDFLAVAGEIDPVADAGGFTYFQRLTDVVNVPVRVPGDYTIRLLDANGAVLKGYAFTPEAINDFGTLSFGEVVNFAAGTRQVILVNLVTHKVLASQAVSANPPVISNVHLVSPPSPVSGEVTLAWNASDPDGGQLLFEVYYSRDGGSSFQPVAANLAGNSTPINTNRLGGSPTGVFRVYASDGANRVYADSPAYQMANKTPTVFILTPADNHAVHWGQLVNFNGMALDVQDGTVDNGGLVWKNEGGDVLGTGPLLSLTNLPVGANLITLEATNSVGRTGSASVTVLVDDDLNLPGPTLTAGPTQVGWHVTAGSSELQYAQVSINNAGGGNLDWTASETAGWLTLSAESGTVAYDGDASILTLTADPSGRAPGQTLGTVLTLTCVSPSCDPEQTLTIPVSLGIGYTWTAPPETVEPGERLFLPVIQH